MEKYNLHFFDNVRKLQGNTIMKHRFIFAILMSLVLTFFMSAWLTYINLGAIDDFSHYWIAAWLLAWPAAGVISFICGPQIHQLAHKIAGKL